MAVLLEISELGEFKKVLDGAGNKKVIVDFYADWCGPCKHIAPRFKEWAETYADTVIAVKVDVDHAGEVSEKYGIRAMPTFMVFKNGKKVSELKGADQGKLKAMFAD